MTTEVRTARETLMGLEAQAREHYEAMFAKGCFDVVYGMAHVDLPSGERFMVQYMATGLTRFYYRERAFQMLSPVENRTVCLLALEARMKVTA